MEERNSGRRTSHFTQLKNALTRKDLAFVDSILYEGSPFINLVEPITGDTELHLIIVNDDPTKDWTSKFINLGSNINAQNAMGDTPLHRLLMANVLFPQPKVLVRNGADMNILNESGFSPFQYALLARGCTAIDMFYPEEHIHPGNYRSLVKGLLDHGKSSNLNLCSTNYSTILHFALEFADFDTFNFLLNNTSFNINALNISGETLLHYSIRKTRNLQVIRTLLNNDASIHKRTGFNYSSVQIGYTALHIAVMTNAPEIAKILLSQGANPNLQSLRGCPLHIVSEKTFWSVEKAKLLLDFGADINARKLLDHKTPLHIACEQGCFEAVEFLVDHGANLRRRCSELRTALHYAALGNNVSVVELILGEGLDPNQCDVSLKTPLFYAVNKDANYSSMLSMRLLIDSGADINARDYKGDTALHRSCKFLYEQPTSVLLELNADINAVNKMGNTPIERAMQSHRRHDSFRLRRILETLCLYMDLAKNGSLDDEKMRKIKSDELVRSVYMKYEEEVKLMKERIHESNYVSYFDFLTCDAQKLAVLTRNKTLMEILAKGEYRRKFPLYNNLLSDRIEDGKVRRNLIERIYVILNKITRRHLPLFVVDIIVSGLSFSDLWNFKRAYKHLRGSKFS